MSKQEDFEILDFVEMDPKRGPCKMKVYKKDRYTFEKTLSYVLKVQLAFHISNVETGEVYKNRPEKED